MLLILENSLLSTGNGFFVKNVSLFSATIAHTRVLIHVTRARARNVSGFLVKSVLVRTISKFVVRLSALSITKKLANQRELIFLRNARHHSNVKRV
jgi:hypothetical protein